ncbi:unnamed protein product [Owenia fusiformis]|uniref:Uncharacterized protein n=1 Tax=Owenia fusiformis TaxID=6347 RepID=A0A8S4PEE6_OWEFU|nr:unnamed protein product [Owenia fusiformis]
MSLKWLECKITYTLEAWYISCLFSEVSSVFVLVETTTHLIFISKMADYKTLNKSQLLEQLGLRNLQVPKSLTKKQLITIYEDNCLEKSDRGEMDSSDSDEEVDFPRREIDLEPTNNSTLIAMITELQQTVQSL